MVNQNQGKVYEPMPIFNRKLTRGIIRSQIIKKYGQHNVSAQMANTYKMMRKEVG